MYHRRQKSSTNGGGSKPTWLEQDAVLEDIKLTLFDSRTLSPHKLDRESIFRLNKSGLEDETFFILVKRAASEWLLAKDYHGHALPSMFMLSFLSENASQGEWVDRNKL